MSMIQAEISAIRSPASIRPSSIRRMPRAAGLLSAAALSAVLWCAALEGLRLAF